MKTKVITIGHTTDQTKIICALLAWMPDCKVYVQYSFPFDPNNIPNYENLKDSMIFEQVERYCGEHDLKLWSY